MYKFKEWEFANAASEDDVNPQAGDEGGDEDKEGDSSSSMKKNHNLIMSSEFQKQQQNHQPQNENENENSDDEGHSWMIPVKAAHDASFDEYVSSGAFCELDIDTFTVMKLNICVRGGVQRFSANSTNIFQVHQTMQCLICRVTVTD